MNRQSLLGCALGGVLLAVSAPAFASASSERAETRQLNLQAAEDARGPAPVAFAAKDAAINAPDNSPPAAAPTAMVKVAAAGQPGSARDGILSAIANPPTRIATANVFDRNGALIGAVQKVNLGANGMPTDLNIALTGKDERFVTLDAGAVRYEPADNKIVASQTRDEILAMPSAQPLASGGIKG